MLKLTVFLICHEIVLMLQYSSFVIKLYYITLPCSSLCSGYISRAFHRYNRSRKTKSRFDRSMRSVFISCQKYMNSITSVSLYGGYIRHCSGVLRGGEDWRLLYHTHQPFFFFKKSCSFIIC